MSSNEIKKSLDVKPKVFYGYIIVIVAFFVIVLGWGMYGTFGVFFEPMLMEFGWLRATISGSFSLLIIFSGLLGIVTGRLNDRYGPRAVVGFSSLFFGLGYLLMSQMTVVWQLYLFYGVILGIGLSSAWVPLMSTIARWFVKRRGLMTSVITSGFGLSLMMMPPVASWLVSTYSWRFSYIIIGIITMVFIMIAAQFMRRDPSQMGLSPYGMDSVKEERLNPGDEGFSFREVVHTRQFWILCVIYFFFLFSLSTITVHIVLHATGLGISLASAANIIAISGGVSIPGGIIIGGVADNIGNRLALVICFVLMAIALIWLLAIREIWMFYLFAAIFGFSYGGLMVLMSPTVAKLFGLSSHGTILGFVNFSGMTGEAIGAVVAGYIFDTSGSYQLAFLICIILIIIAGILTLLLRRTYDQELQTDHF